MKSIINYYGGKGVIAKKLIPLIPAAPLYVEPFCGGASVFFARQSSGVEVLNDLNGLIISLYRVLQDRQLFREFNRRVKHTPWSLAEFERAIELQTSSDIIDRAWACFVLQNMSFSGTQRYSKSNWRRSLKRQTTTDSHINRIRRLVLYHQRLLHVQLDNRDAIEVLRYWDRPDTVFYCDPPYILSTRQEKTAYTIEQSDLFHRTLINTLCSLDAGVLLSGYNHPIFRSLTGSGWVCDTFKVKCSAANKSRANRIECLYRNPRALELLDRYGPSRESE